MDSSSIKPEQLRTIKSLSRCTEEERMAFLEFVELVPCAKGVLLIQEGDEGDCMYFIVAGEMRVFTRKKNGQELTLKMLGAGDAFGDVALFHGLMHLLRSCHINTLQALGNGPKYWCRLSGLPRKNRSCGYGSPLMHRYG